MIWSHRVQWRTDGRMTKRWGGKTRWKTTRWTEIWVPSPRSTHSPPCNLGSILKTSPLFIPATPISIYAKAPSVRTCSCILWNIVKSFWVQYSENFSKTTCEFMHVRGVVWLSAMGSVGRNSCDSAPWGECSSFSCKHNPFSCWQSHEPPPGRCASGYR